MPFIKRPANPPSQAVAIRQPPTMVPRSSRTLTVQDEPQPSTPTAVIDNEDSPPPSPNPRRSQRQKEKANKDDDKSDDNAQVEFLAPRCFSFMVSSNVT